MEGQNTFHATEKEYERTEHITLENVIHLRIQRRLPLEAPLFVI